MPSPKKPPAEHQEEVQEPEKIEPQKAESAAPKSGDDSSEPESNPCTHRPKPPPLGNFALPTSQQVAPLVSFGQLILEANTLQFYLLGNFFYGRESFSSTLTPAILYGLTDHLSAYLQLPFSPGSCQGNDCSAGMGDILLQLEYAYYYCSTRCFTNQGTIVSYITYPTGDAYKDPPTGLGAPSFFIGATFNHVTRCWYGFFSTGGLFPTESFGTKFGDEYLYQFGCERVICAITGRMLFSFMVEFDGIHSGKNRFHGVVDPNSGGNEIWITPSLWFSTIKWILQGGLSFPALQALNGHQTKESLGFYFILGYTW